MFVANRIHQIKENKRVDQWHYVSSKENPTDNASRGLDPRKKTTDSCWFHGPSFLREVEALWQNKDCSIGSLKDDVELKREAKRNTIQIVHGMLANTERQVSSWTKLKHIVRYVLLYKKNCFNLVKRVNQNRKKSQIERFIATRTIWKWF